MIKLRSLFLASAALCAVTALAADSTTDWKVSGPFGGTATAIAVDPQNTKTVLAGGLDSLLFETEDAGLSWFVVPFPKRNLGEITSILVDPADSTHFLVGVMDPFGGGLFESHDGGKNWAANSDMQELGVRSLAAAASKPGQFVAGTVKGVMMSADSGKSWTRISDPNNLEMIGITSLAIDPKDANIIYAGTSHLPWKTTDAGKTWESIHTGMIDDSDVFSIYVDPQQPSDVYASACSGIYASNNRGDNWRKIAGIPNTSRRTHVIRVDPTQSNVVYAGTTNGLYKSLNAGTTWKTVADNQVNSIAFDPAQPKTIYFAMLTEGLGKSDDGGQTIRMVNTGFVDRQINSVTVSGKKLVAIETQNGGTTGLFASADNGETWAQLRPVNGLPGVHLRSIIGAASNDHVLLAATSNQLFRSADGGGSWKPMSLKVVSEAPQPKAATPTRTTRGRTSRAVRPARPVKPRMIAHQLTPSQVDAIFTFRNGSKDVFIASTNLGLFLSDDLGEQWTAITWTGTATVTGLYVSPVNDGRMALRTNQGLLLSKDFGTTWQSATFPLPAADINDIALPPTPDGRILAATRVGVYSSPDGGGNWVAGGDGIQSSTVSAVIYAGSSDAKAYAVEYGSLFQSADGGKSWTLSPSSLRSLQIRQLWIPDNSSNRLFGITSGMGILFRNQ